MLCIFVKKNKLVSFLGAIFFIYIIFFKIFLDSKAEAFSGGDALADISIDLCVAYIASLFFYYFTAFLPRENDRKIVSSDINLILRKIKSNLLYIIHASLTDNIKQVEISQKTLTEEKIKEALKNNFLEDEIPEVSYFVDGKRVSRGETLIDLMTETNKDIDHLLRYIIFLDPNTITIINEILNNSFNKNGINSHALERLTLYSNYDIPLPKRDLSCFSKDVFSYYSTYLKLTL